MQKSECNMQYCNITFSLTFFEVSEIIRNFAPNKTERMKTDKQMSAAAADFAARFFVIWLFINILIIFVVS